MKNPFQVGEKKKKVDRFRGCEMKMKSENDRKVVYRCEQGSKEWQESDDREKKA